MLDRCFGTPVLRFQGNSAMPEVATKLLRTVMRSQSVLLRLPVLHLAWERHDPFMEVSGALVMILPTGDRNEIVDRTDDSRLLRLHGFIRQLCS